MTTFIIAAKLHLKNNTIKYYILIIRTKSVHYILWMTCYTWLWVYPLSAMNSSYSWSEGHAWLPILWMKLKGWPGSVAKGYYVSVKAQSHYHNSREEWPLIMKNTKIMMIFHVLGPVRAESSQEDCSKNAVWMQYEYSMNAVRNHKNTERMQ